jgi:hypothetical protein
MDPIGFANKRFVVAVGYPDRRCGFPLAWVARSSVGRFKGRDKMKQEKSIFVQLLIEFGFYMHK